MHFRTEIYRLRTRGRIRGCPRLSRFFAGTNPRPFAATAAVSYRRLSAQPERNSHADVRPGREFVDGCRIAQSPFVG
jgi:hypothetical protein